MAYDGWIEFNGREFINLSRTAQLAVALGLDSVWTEPSEVSWIQDALDSADYDLIATAPWYDEGYPASSEFAGIIPLSITGLDDSTLEASSVEYITDGGATGKSRNRTLVMVANVAIVASTMRGADFGKRWMDRQLRGGGTSTCAGADLRYFRYKPEGGEAVDYAHRRDVAITRGSSVTRKRSTPCSATWLVTFTWTAGDPFEYGEEIAAFAGLGDAVTGPMVDSSGAEVMVEESCPVYDYSSIYDPLYPALVPAPTAPNFYPPGWVLLPGIQIVRRYVRLSPVEPTVLGMVPVLTLRANEEARMLRVSIWPGLTNIDDFCDPLWSVIVSYLPAGQDFVVDGKQQAVYAWDGVSPSVRRTDSLAYAPQARPIEWASFNDPDGLLVTLDIIDDPEFNGNGSVTAALSLVPKSD